jgi:hypothetical protein
LAEEGLSLGVRLTNVARSYALETAAIGAVKRTQLRNAVTNIAAETREYVASTATKLKYESIYQMGRAQRGLNSLRTMTIPQIKQEVSAVAKATQEKIAHKVREIRANGRWTIAGARQSLTTIRKDVAAFATATQEKIAYKAREARANINWNIAIARQSLTAYSAPIKNIASKAGNSLKSMWRGVQFASLDAAKRSRMSWLASTGASVAELKKLERALNSVKSKADLKSSTKIQGLTQGYGGFRGTMGRMGGKFGGAAMGVGMGRRILDTAIRYATERKAFGEAIANFQLIQAMLADSEAELYAAECMIADACARADRGEAIMRKAAAAKLFASETCGRVADRCVQIYGGAGYLAEYPAERFFRDARILRIYEGTSQIMQLQIAKHLLREFDREGAVW